MLLQALNDQNQAAIDERLATESVKDWINLRALTEQLDNPIRQFKDVKRITCLAFASLVSDDATLRQLVEAGADTAITESLELSLMAFDGRERHVYSALHYACASDVDADAKVAYLIQRDASSQTATGDSELVVPDPEFYAESLRLAALLNQADRVRALIDDHGVSVNATDWRGRTAFIYATEALSAEAVEVLLPYLNFDPSIVGNWGRLSADDIRRLPTRRHSCYF